jgi:hypothetical protein
LLLNAEELGCRLAFRLYLLGEPIQHDCDDNEIDAAELDIRGR